MTPEMISTEELARRWQMHPKTLSNWRVQGRGPVYVKLGGRNATVLYRLVDIEAYERAGMRDPKKARQA